MLHIRTLRKFRIRLLQTRYAARLFFLGRPTLSVPNAIVNCDALILHWRFRFYNVHSIRFTVALTHVISEWLVDAIPESHSYSFQDCHPFFLDDAHSKCDAWRS